MGDFPRWVNRWDVDSSAMLSAFLQYHTESCQPLDDEHLSFQPSWYGHLCVVIHRDADWVLAQTKVPMPPVIREVPCRQPGCHRCGVRGGRGGRVSVVQSILGAGLQRVAARGRLESSAARALSRQAGSQRVLAAAASFLASDCSMTVAMVLDELSAASHAARGL